MPRLQMKTTWAALLASTACSLAGCYSTRSVGVDLGFMGSWDVTADFAPNQVYTFTDVSYADFVSLGVHAVGGDGAFTIMLTPDLIDGIRSAGGRPSTPLRLSVVPMAGLWFSDGSSEPIYGFRIDVRRHARALAGGSHDADLAEEPARYIGFSLGHASLPDSANWLYFIRCSFVREW